MSDFSAIGPPKGNPLARLVGGDAIRGDLDPYVRRRLWTDAGKHQATRTPLGDVLTLGGNAPALVSGFVDANIGLFRGIRDLTGLSFGLQDADVPRTASDLLPKGLARNLAGTVADAEVFGLDSEAASRFAGELMAYMGTGGTGAVAKGARMLNPVAQVLHPLSRVGALGARALAQSQKLGRFAKAAKALEPAIAGATGFGLYNALATEGDWEERKAAMLHGMVAGAAIGVAGQLARSVETAMLRKSLTPEQIDQLGKLLKTVRAGKLPSWDQTVAALAKTGAGTVGTLVENTAFATLNSDFWRALAEHDYDRALEHYVTTIPGTVLARTGRPDGFLGFRREMPDVNTTETRLLTLEFRRAPMREHGPKDTPPPVRTEGEAGSAPPKLLPYTAPKRGPAPDDAIVRGSAAKVTNKDLDALADPLWKSGWEIPDGLPKKGTIEIEYPGGWRVTLDLDGSTITVPRRVFRLVRGEDASIEKAASVDPVLVWARNTIENFDAKAKNPARRVEVDADIARALLSRAPENTAMHRQLREIVESNAPYGPVEVSRVDLAKTALRWHTKTAEHPNAERVDAWLSELATDLHGRALAEQEPGSVGSKIAETGLVPIADTVTMSGDVARAFIRDLAALTMLRRMGSEMLFRAPEQTAGGYWKSPDGRLVFVGLDGKPYSRRLQSEGDPDIREIRNLAKPELRPPDTPQLREWHALVESLRGTSTRQNIGLDLLEAGIATASNGAIGSPSVQQLREFFHALDPKVVAQRLTPESLRELGVSVGRMGSGHGTAAREIQELASAFAQIGDARKAAQEALRKAEERPEDPDEARLHEMRSELERQRDEAHKSGDDAVADALEEAVQQLNTRSRYVMRMELRRQRDEALDEGDTAVARALDEAIERLGREGEAGFFNAEAFAETLRAAGRGASRTMREVRDILQRAVDHLFETRAEAVRKVMPKHPLSRKVRQAFSLGREVLGHAQERWIKAEKLLKRNKGGRAWANEWMVLDEGGWRAAREGEVGEYRRWELVADGRIEIPKDAPDWQREYAAAHREVNRYLFDTAARFGAVRATATDPAQPRPLMTGRNVTQRVPGRDADEVMGSAPLRKRWFAHLMSRPQNRDVTVGEGAKARKLTAEDLEAAYQASRTRDVDALDAEREAAFEHYRLLPDVPMQWRDPGTGRVYEMRESDPADVMSRIVRSQSLRAATIGVLGQDLTPKQRKNLIQWLESPEAASLPAEQRAAVRRNALERLGPTGEWKAWRDMLYSDSPDAPQIGVRRKERLAERALEWVQMAQGRYPATHPVASAVLAFDLIPRAFQVAKAFAWDLPEMVMLPAYYGGVKRTIAALRDFFANPADSVRMAWRVGAVMRGMGELVLGEVHKPQLSVGRVIHAVANGLSAPGAVTEWAKGAINTVLADKMLEGWSQGQVHSRDRWLLEHMRFTPKEIDALLSGEAPRGLRSQFRNEFVQMVTSRRGFGEGSAFADDPNARAWLRFLRWASARAGEVARTAADIGEAAREHGWLSREAMQARGRLAMQLGTYGASGMAGMLAGYLVTAVLSGDLDRGWPRFLRELSHSPLGMFGEALFSQTVGGPWARAASASTEPDNARLMASLTVPTSMLYSIGKGLQAVAKGDVGKVYEMLRTYGWIPLASDMERLGARLKMQGWVKSLFANDVLVSQQDEAISDRDLLTEWRYGAGQERGNLLLPVESGGHFAPSNDPAFYRHMKDALGVFYDVMGTAPEDEPPSKSVRRGFAAALDHLEQARAVDGVKKGSIASYIRSQQHFNGMTADDVLRFMQYAGQERTSRMLTHDRMLAGLALEANRLRDVPIGDAEWAARADRFRRLAQVGKLDRETLDDAIAYSAAMLRNGAYDASRVQDIAHALAMGEGLVRQVFTGKRGQGIVLIDDHATRALVIESELMRRARRAARDDEQGKQSDGEQKR